MIPTIPLTVETKSEEKVVSSDTPPEFIFPLSLVRCCPIRKAIDLINATRYESVESDGSVQNRSFVYDKDMITMAKSLFSPGKKYSFQLHATNTISAAVTTGIVAFSFALNPGVTSFSEWTALSALFDECRAARSKFQFVSYGTAIPVFLGFDQVTTTGVAPGYANVQRLSGSKYFNAGYCVGGSGHEPHSASIVTERNYSTTTTPISTTIDVGMNGQWDFVGQATITPSAMVGWAALTVDVNFRCRA
jgi:hypothetical protein